MNRSPVTNRYLAVRLGAVVGAMALSALIGFGAGMLNQQAVAERIATTNALARAHLDVSNLRVDFRALVDADDSQRRASAVAYVRRDGERIAETIDILAGLTFDDPDGVAEVVRYLELMARVAERVTGRDAPTGEQLRRPVMIALGIGREIMPELGELRRREDVAFRKASDLFERMNLLGFAMEIVVIAMAWFLIIRPMRHAVLDSQSAMRMEQVRAEAERANAEAEREKAEEASRAKSDFLAVMSHEIRTPLNGVLGTADILLTSDLAPRHKSSVEVIAASGAALMSVIDDVLDISKIESGRIEVEATAFDLGALLDDVAALFGGAAIRKGVGLSVERPPGRLSIVSDPKAIRQSVSNLVGNAMKFTEEGSVAIVARSAPGGWSEGVRIDVRDTGIGIPEEASSRIFESFEQAETSTTRRFGGTGLGLTISRQFVEALGGTLDMRSVSGEGSTFTISLDVPVDVAAADAGPSAKDAGLRSIDDRGPAGVRSGGERRPGLRTLVVDDSAVNVRVLVTLLGRLGIVAEDCRDGRSAVERFAAAEFDLVFMDISMPGMDGLEATMRMRAREAEQGRAPARIVGLSAHAGAEHRTAAIAAGMSDYLTKPIRLDALAEALPERTCRLTA